MTLQPNGTDAKEIALYFFNLVGRRATKQAMGKTINQAKELLKSGYSVQEVTDVLDYLVNIKKLDLYSLGYLLYAIENTIREMKEVIERKTIKLEVETITKKQQCEVSIDDDSRKRNRNKARGFGVQCRVGEEYNFDMLKE